MAKKSTKDRVQRAKSAATNAAIRGAGTVAAALAVNTALPKMVTNPDSPIRKHKGAAALLMGIAVEALVDEPMIQTAAQGVQAYGALQAAQDYMPESMKSGGTVKLGLSGADADELQAAAEALTGTAWQRKLKPAPQ